ncbi:MAG: 4Fe-4S dicluster domain-containing protein [Chloroflexi bacterium]|nr:4Fe-4S dicluster domain-containing protein [Chloroflexota bacterium]
MARKITDACDDCGACEWECDVNHAITEVLKPVHEPTVYLIDPDKCTECVGNYKVARCAAVCPVGAIIKDPEHRETKKQLLAKWYSLHPGQQPVAGTY